MLGAVVRVPCPILLPLLLPGPTRPLLRRRSRHCLPPEPPMSSATPRDGDGSPAKPDAAPAAATPAPLPLPPEKPLPGDCCGSGCVRCVWDIYFDELDAYDKALAAHAAASSGSGAKEDSADANKPSDGAKS